MSKHNSWEIGSAVIVLLGIAVAVAAALKGILVLALCAWAAVVLTGFIRHRRISDRAVPSARLQ